LASPELITNPLNQKVITLTTLQNEIENSLKLLLQAMEPSGVAEADNFDQKVLMKDLEDSRAVGPRSSPLSFDIGISPSGFGYHDLEEQSKEIRNYAQNEDIVNSPIISPQKLSELPISPQKFQENLEQKINGQNYPKRRRMQLEPTNPIQAHQRIQKKPKQVGRKIRNLPLENFVLHFIKQYIFLKKRVPKRKLIISHALSFKNKGSFKASKGWCDKFMKRNKSKFEKWKRGDGG
jgi:hypothetical protein